MTAPQRNLIDEATIAARRRALFEVFGEFRQADELDDGYRYVYARTDRARANARLLAELWARGYPTLTVVIDTADAPVITITGPDGTKPFLRDLTEVVARSRGSVRIARFAWRLATAWSRVTPDFLLIGAAKCGTTALYDYLVQHPSVAPAQTKEIYFLTNTFRRNRCKRTALWYRAHFPSALRARRIRRDTGHFLTGEATPSYIFHRAAPRRAHALRPDAKLIALLRNPVDMAYSLYQMKLRGGIETLSFEDAIDCEAERLAGEAARQDADENYYSLARDHFAYLTRGHYVEQLERWLAQYPREQLLVLESGRFRRDPNGVVRETHRFLGLPERDVTKPPRANSGGPHAPLAPATRERLEAYFRPWNERLYELLGEDFGW